MLQTAAAAFWKNEIHCKGPPYDPLETPDETAGVETQSAQTRAAENSPPDKSRDDGYVYCRGVVAI